TLNGIHDIWLLSQHSIAQFLRPIELLAHHGENGWRCRQRLHAVVPSLLLDLCLEPIAVKVLVLTGPAFSLHHFERIGRSHQNLGQQGVWIERNRRDERIKLLGFERLLARALGRRTWVLRPQPEGRERKQHCQQSSNRPSHPAHGRGKLVGRSPDRPRASSWSARDGAHSLRWDRGRGPFVASRSSDDIH